MTTGTRARIASRRNDRVAASSDVARLRAQLEEKTRDFDRLRDEHRELSTRHRYLVKELKRAGQLQRSLLPSQLPEHPGFHFATLYRPCEAVGGDFYDFVDVEQGTLVLVADVVGHGMEAGLTTMLLKHVFRQTADDDVAPAELLRRMNARLHGVLPPGVFAVAALVRIPNGGGEVELSNAGLPYPFVLRRAGCHVRELEQPGFPLGLFPDARYEDRPVVLAPGDVVLLSTDGLHSITDAGDRHFENERMRGALSRVVGRDGEIVILGLMAEASAFGCGTQFPDDVNLVAITRCGGECRCEVG